MRSSFLKIAIILLSVLYSCTKSADDSLPLTEEIMF